MIENLQQFLANLGTGQAVALVIISFALVITILTIVGSGNSIVVFTSPGEVLSAFIVVILGILIVPLSFIAATYVLPGGISYQYSGIWQLTVDLVAGGLITSIILSLLSIILLYSVFQVVARTFLFNSFVAAVILLPLKLIAIAGLVALFIVSPIVGFILYILKMIAWGNIAEMFDADPNVKRHGIMRILFLGTAGWCITRMINGHRVLKEQYGGPE